MHNQKDPVFFSDFRMNGAHQILLAESGYSGQTKCSGFTLHCSKSMSHPHAEDSYTERIRPNDKIMELFFPALLNDKRVTNLRYDWEESSQLFPFPE